MIQVGSYIGGMDEQEPSYVPALTLPAYLAMPDPLDLLPV